MHGGKSPKGMASASTIHGGYSKWMGAASADLYAQIAEERETFALTEELNLTKLLLAQASAKLDKKAGSGELWDEAKTAFLDFKRANQSGDSDAQMDALSRLQSALFTGAGDGEARAEIKRLVEIMRKLKESERKRYVETRDMIPLKEAELVYSALCESIGEHVTDPVTIQKIADDFARILRGSSTKSAASLDP